MKPAPHLFSSGGCAVRSGDGRGHWASLVQGSCRFAFSLQVASLAFGLVPLYRSLLLPHAGSDKRSPACSSGSPPWWRKQEGCGFGGSFLNKPGHALNLGDLEISIPFLARLGGGGDEELESFPDAP